jgi:hypothetical protein
VELISLFELSLVLNFVQYVIINRCMLWMHSFPVYSLKIEEKGSAQCGFLFYFLIWQPFYFLRFKILVLVQVSLLVNGDLKWSWFNSGCDLKFLCQL